MTLWNRFVPCTLAAAVVWLGNPSPSHADDAAATLPFLVDYQTLKARVDTVALTTMSVAEGLGDPATVRATFAPLIRSGLEEAGFKVVPDDAAMALIDDLLRRSGGVYDVLTGRQDRAKAELIRGHWYRELGEQYGVDAMVHSSMMIVSARFGTDNVVEACGREMSMRPEGESGFGKFMEDTLIGSVYGVTKVVCLGLMIDDLAGVAMYRQLGGVEPMSIVDSAKMSTKNVDDLFRKDADNRAAVAVVVKPLELGRVWVNPGESNPPRERVTNRPGESR